MIKIRAHHLLCIPRFYRGGYNKKFADNMKQICLEIRKNPREKIKVIIGKPDNLCEKCPYLFKNRCIQSKKISKWVTDQDRKVPEYLRVGQNSIHKAKEIFNLSMYKVNPKTIKKICKNCIFLTNCQKVGINKSFQKDINKNLK